MRSSRSVLLVPLLVVAILGGMLGFVVTKQLDPASGAAQTRVGVITLPATSTPTPSATPKETGSSVTVRSGRGSSSGCPAGCQCRRPPNGIVIICR